MKGLIPYALALLAVSGVAIAQQPSFITPALPPEPAELPPNKQGPRRLTISISVSDPDDLKVSQGDRIQPGQLIADRGRERRRLDAQAKQLTLNLQRLKQASITPPLPPPTHPPLTAPTYLEQDAAIAKAKSAVTQAEASITTKRQELEYLAMLENLDPLVLEHEQANLSKLQLQHTAAVRDYQLAMGKRSSAEYDHSRSMAIDASSRNRDQLSYQAQWAQYEQRLRDRDYQLSQTQLKLDDIQNAIATLSVVRSPYGGRVRRIKWLGQDASGLLNAEITLMVRSSDGAAVPEQFDGVSGNADGAGDRTIIGD